MVVLIDNGHGSTTPGKCSPDKTLREYKYCREIARMVLDQLTKLGIQAYLIVDSDSDVSLSTRCRIINSYCQKFGTSNCLSISIHCNAAGAKGEWLNAKGWSVFISPNASQRSKWLADSLCDAAGKLGLKLRKPLPNQKYWVQNLAMCRDTKCPAVLTENLFMDNKEDVKFLLSSEGKEKIAKLHVDGILDYIKKLQ